MVMAVVVAVVVVYMVLAAAAVMVRCGMIATLESLCRCQRTDRRTRLLSVSPRTPCHFPLAPSPSFLPAALLPVTSLHPSPSPYLTVFSPSTPLSIPSPGPLPPS